MAQAPFVLTPALVAIVNNYANVNMTARGYIQDQVVPRVTVDAPLFRYPEYPIEEAFTVYDDQVGRLDRLNEIVESATEQTGAVIDHGLLEKIPFRDMMAAENQSIPFSLKARAARNVVDKVQLNREIRVASLITTPANYQVGYKVTLAGTAQWSDFVNSDPVAVVNDAAASMLIPPNVAVMSKAVRNILRRHPKVSVALGGSQESGRYVTDAELAQALGVERIIIGNTLRATTKRGQALTTGQIWGQASCAPLYPAGQLRRRDRDRRRQPCLRPHVPVGRQGERRAGLSSGRNGPLGRRRRSHGRVACREACRSVRRILFRERDRLSGRNGGQAMRYFANFEGDEIDGVRYKIGEEITSKDVGVLAYLVSNGRITERADDDDGDGSSLGEPGVGTGIPDRKPVEDMRRPELLAEARRAFDAHIGTADDDQLRVMVEGARDAADRTSEATDVSNLDPAQRDAMTGGPAAQAPAPEPRDSFVPASIVAGNVDDTIAQLDGLDADQLAAVRAAEEARPGGARKGVTDALDAREAK
jgi:hypothetical protein